MSADTPTELATAPVENTTTDAPPATPPPLPGASPRKRLRLDGPTLEEFVAAGYKAENYPPMGYAARTAGQPPVQTPEPLTAKQALGAAIGRAHAGIEAALRAINLGKVTVDQAARGQIEGTYEAIRAATAGDKLVLAHLKRAAADLKILATILANAGQQHGEAMSAARQAQTQAEGFTEAQ